MEKAKQWIYSKGRDLEITIFNALFYGDKEDVLTSLTLYLSEDGGFGNQLFYNAVGSTIFETYYALKVLIDVKYDLEDDGTIDGAFTYLFNNNIEESPYLAGCLGAGIKLLKKGTKNYQKCVDLLPQVIANYQAMDIDHLKSYILLFDALETKEIEEKLKKDLYEYVSLSEINPLELINNSRLVNNDLKPLVEKNIKEIMDSRLSSGAWCYIDVDDIETIKKSGTLTINNILILKNFGLL